MVIDDDPYLFQRGAQEHREEAAAPVVVSRLPLGGLIFPHCAAGGLVRVLPRVSYSFQPVVATSEVILLAKYVDVSLWVNAALIARLHASSFSSEQQFSIEVWPVSFAEEDPAADLVSINPIAAVSFDANTNTPTLLVDDFATPVPAEVRVTLRARQDERTADPMSCTVGVDLVGRPA